MRYAWKAQSHGAAKGGRKGEGRGDTADALPGLGVIPCFDKSLEHTKQDVSVEAALMSLIQHND